MSVTLWRGYVLSDPQVDTMLNTYQREIDESRAAGDAEAAANAARLGVDLVVTRVAQRLRMRRSSNA